MDYQQALQSIHSLGRFRNVAGLSPVMRMLELMGNPQDSLKFVHVAGTNGKGSIVTMLAEMLLVAGNKVGKYTSPFVVEFRERIQINNIFIPEQELASLTEELLPLALQVAREQCPLLEFDFITCLAMAYFAQQECSIVVLEVGIGGRLDPTNIIKKPLLAVIATIDLDHTEVLGDTLEAIAAEKCGIFKEGVPVVCAPNQQDSVLAVVMEHAAQLGCSLTLPSIAGVQIEQMGLQGTVFSYGGQKWELGLVGQFQLTNAITALEAGRLLGAFGVGERVMKEGLKRARIPARLEVLSQQPLVLLDGAHNLSGATALAQALHALGCHSLTAITGMLGEKDWQHTMQAIAPLCCKMIAVTPDNPRALSGEVLAQYLENLCPQSSFAPTLPQAYAMAKQGLAEGEGILIFGSLYLASTFRSRWQPVAGSPRS